MISFFIPQSRKSAAMMAWISGVFAGVLLLIAAFLLGQSYVRQSTWIPITATVTNYAVSDGHNVWTEFVYEVNGEQHIIRMDGHSYWMYEGTEVQLLCSPRDHEETVYPDRLTSAPEIMGIVGLIFTGIWLLYLLDYFYWRRKEKNRS